MEPWCAGFCRQNRRLPVYFGFNAFGGEGSGGGISQILQPWCVTLDLLSFLPHGWVAFATPLSPS
ncbi:uncharacterized protein CTRU02_202017 [Colletotrichum truncatum]|uniref:Uncharacterized protein n=1 Tax=Colletotrichum truncatum TaxID=5467 RepID=A0ACC3ZJ94_COLTU|nr:uncharacterized protein CTRU02_07134 [Colletotrichum truncatum]KAF6791950.1 hypothetical protein CTRU02_07134 [Colletotrichum truncatum]